MGSSGVFVICNTTSNYTVYHPSKNMGRLLIIACMAVLVAVISARSHGGGAPPTFECAAHHGDGFYADSYRACKVFYVCEDGVKSTFGCDHNLCFNQSVRSCEPCDMVDCPYPEGAHP